MLAERRLVCSGSHRLAKAKNGTTLLTDYIRSEILNFKYNASWNGVALLLWCTYARNRTIAGVDRGPDLDVERSSQAEAEKKAYDSVGVK